MPAPAASVVISTYNQPQWLRKCLLGYARQDRTDFEMVLADDGSGAETAAMVESLRPQLPFELKHVWQEDIGFRKCRALNQGIKAAQADYLVFSDGDCIPRADFVSQHLRQREAGRYLAAATASCRAR